MHCVDGGLPPSPGFNPGTGAARDVSPRAYHSLVTSRLPPGSCRRVWLRHGAGSSSAGAAAVRLRTHSGSPRLVNYWWLGRSEPSTLSLQLNRTWWKDIAPPLALQLQLWRLMSLDVGWHIRDKLRPMPMVNIALRPRKPDASLGWTAQEGHLDWLSHSSWNMICLTERFSFLMSSDVSHFLPYQKVNKRGASVTSTEIIRLI